jgi:hypothetical protein
VEQFTVVELHAATPAQCQTAAVVAVDADNMRTHKFNTAEISDIKILQIKKNVLTLHFGKRGGRYLPCFPLF